MSIIETMVDEISQFLNISRDEVCQRIEEEIFNPGINVARAWKRAHPITEEEINNFYKTTDAYIFDLYVEHQRVYRKIILERIVERLKINNTKFVLDYGGGAGFDAIEMRKAGINVVYFELPNLTSRFAEWKFIKSGYADIKVAYDEKMLKKHDFNAIVCLEVLEHIAKPMEVIKSFSYLLKDEGIILLSEAFELVGDEYPSHLKINQKYAGRIFDMMEKYRFICTHKYDDNKPLEFKKMEKGIPFMLCRIQRRWLELLSLIRKVIKKLFRII